LVFRRQYMEDCPQSILDYQKGRVRVDDE